MPGYATRLHPNIERDEAYLGRNAERFLPTEYDLGRCALKLQDSTLFAVHADYIRRQFVQSLVEVRVPGRVCMLDKTLME